MAQAPVSREVLQLTLDTYTACGGSVVETSKRMNIPPSTITSRLRTIHAQGLTPSVEDPNDPSQLKSQIRRLTEELKRSEQERLDHTVIKHKIIQLTRSVSEIEPPSWIKRTDSSHSKPGVPTLFLSDLHWGEVVDGKQINGVNRYDMEIARERLGYVAERAVHLCKIISPKMEYPGMVLALGGDMMCFPTGTYVTMHDGSVKEIERVEAGDQIIGRHGVASVQKTHVRKSTKRDVLKTLHTCGSISVSGTEGHVVAVLPRERVETGWNPGGGRKGFVIRDKDGVSTEDIVWKTLADVRPGDYLIARPHRGFVGNDFFDIPSITQLELDVDGDRLVRKVRGTSPSVVSSPKVEASNELLWFIGLFLAEGSFTVGRSGHINGAQFALHIRESDLSDKVASISERYFGYLPRVELKEHVNTRVVHINNQIIATFLHNLCGRGSENVAVGKAVWELGRSLLPLVAGWLDGEGHLHERNRSIIAKTVSPSLARQMLSILQTEGCVPSYHLDDHGRNRTAHVIRLTGASAQLLASYSVRFRSRLDVFLDVYKEVLILDDTLGYRVKTIHTEPYEGDLYDLTIDGHPSYHANGYLVHNSGNIHEELVATNEQNMMPTLLDLFETMCSVIQFLRERFGRLFIPCVGGNHSRITHKTWAKDRNYTSFDWLLYCFLAKRFSDDKNITFLIPDGSDAHYKVYDHVFLLTHGDQFRGGDGVIGCLGPIIRGDVRKRSRNMQINMEYDTLLMGHWHQYIQLQRLIVNGSTKGYDEYAYVSNFPFEQPQQALWINHPRYRITYRMPVLADKMRDSKSASWVSVMK
jgi:hypothetical protein